MERRRYLDKWSVQAGLVLVLLTIGGMLYRFGQRVLISMLDTTFETQIAHAADMVVHERLEDEKLKTLAAEVVAKVEAIHHRHDR